MLDTPRTKKYCHDATDIPGWVTYKVHATGATHTAHTAHHLLHTAHAATHTAHARHVHASGRAAKLAVNSYFVPSRCRSGE